MANYVVAHLDEIEQLDERLRAVRHHFGITAFGVTAWTGHAAGDRIINEHEEDEPGSDEELYLVTAGHAVFEVDGDRVDAPAGTFVFARPGVKRTAFAEEAETTILAIGAPAGKAYEANGWELWTPLNALYQKGEYAEVVDRARALIEAHPEFGLLFYNLACCESLLGRTADAVDHLRQAIDMSERAREFAKGDSDFDPIRDEPAFQQLMAE